MKHAFQSQKTQGNDNTIVGPQQWNDTHVVGINAISVNTILDFTYDCVLVVTGGGTISVTLPTAIGNQGRSFVIKKTDSGVGMVTVSTTASQTIDGSTGGYALVVQWQYVAVVSDGTNWLIIANN